MEFEDFIGVGIATVAICGGLGVAYYAMWLDSKKRQLRHIERMAMIEKGIAPTVPGDPGDEAGGWNTHKLRSQRRSGVFMVCLGIGLAFLFGGDGDWGDVWIGGLIAMFGVANLVNALLDDRDRRREISARTGSPER